MKLDLAISPCPNDTFIFCHMAKSGVDGNPVGLVFADVEELNQRALNEGRHRVTKMSYYAMYRARERYRLLRSGGALGHGCGPLLLAYETVSEEKMLTKIKRVLIPGEHTTANLLLRLYLSDRGVDLNQVEFEARRYDEIMPAMNHGEADFGVIIHEERFSYQEQGLCSVVDLGAWWEQTTGHPIPLGCIGVRKDVPVELDRAIETAIRSSISRARRDPASVAAFVKEHSQSLSDLVIQAHIALYVNEYSEDVGETGEEAIAELFRRAEEAGL